MKSVLTGKTFLRKPWKWGLSFQQKYQFLTKTIWTETNKCTNKCPTLRYVKQKGKKYYILGKKDISVLVGL